MKEVKDWWTKKHRPYQGTIPFNEFETFLSSYKSELEKKVDGYEKEMNIDEINNGYMVITKIKTLIKTLREGE